MILRSPAFAKASENVVDDVETPFLWQQPPPVQYGAPQNTANEQLHRYTHNYAESSVQRGSQNLHAGSSSHPPRNVSMQPFYPMADQNVQRNRMPQPGGRASYSQINSPGLRLRPVSDLRTESFGRQSHILTSLPSGCLSPSVYIWCLQRHPVHLLRYREPFHHDSAPTILTLCQVNEHCAEFGRTHVIHLCFHC